MRIKVIPGAKKFELMFRNEECIVKVRSPPEKGKANVEVDRANLVDLRSPQMRKHLLGKELTRLLRVKVRVCKGLKSRDKEIVSEELGDKALENALRSCAGVAEPGQ